MAEHEVRAGTGAPGPGWVTSSTSSPSPPTVAVSLGVLLASGGGRAVRPVGRRGRRPRRCRRAVRRGARGRPLPVCALDPAGRNATHGRSGLRADSGRRTAVTATHP